MQYPPYHAYQARYSPQNESITIPIVFCRCQFVPQGLFGFTLDPQTAYGVNFYTMSKWLVQSIVYPGDNIANCSKDQDFTESGLSMRHSHILWPVDSLLLTPTVVVSMKCPGWNLTAALAAFLKASLRFLRVCA